MSKIIPDSVIEDIRTELEWLGSEMWLSLHVEPQMDGSCMAVIIEIKPDSSRLVKRQICKLIRNACEGRIPYSNSYHSWMGILKINGEVIDSGITAGRIDSEDYDPTAEEE